jgi:RimJ/RimL family protein N-acetyltransferase
MLPFEPVVLKAPRVMLRWIRASDADALFTWYSDPAVTRYLSLPPWTEAGQALKKIETTLGGYESGAHLNFIVERVADAAPIGMAGLFHFHETSRRAEIGYTLARAHWGQGLMHEALVVLVDHAFSALDLNRLEADIDPRNNASGRSLERLGFQKEGVMRERWIVNGEVSDTVFYGLLRSEWKACKRSKA